MKKILIALTSFLAVSAVAQTFTDVNTKAYHGKTNLKNLTVAIDANNALLEASSASVTNGEAVTLSSGSIVLTGIGGANDTTNTITLGTVASTLVGSTVTLVVDTDSTNLITIADSGTANLSAAWVGDNEDTLTLYVLSTTEFVEVSKSDN